MAQKQLPRTVEDLELEGRWSYMFRERKIFEVVAMTMVITWTGLLALILTFVLQTSWDVQRVDCGPRKNQQEVRCAPLTDLTVYVIEHTREDAKIMQKVHIADTTGSAIGDYANEQQTSRD